MSYDIELCDPISKQVLELDAAHHMRGGTYMVGGNPQASLNITYNYAKHFSGFGPQGIRTIYGKTGAESLPLIETVVRGLGDETDPNYWIPTEGNAKRALLQLAALAAMRPDGIWNGD